MKERKPFDVIWNQNRAENRRHNEALYTGWDGKTFRKGIMARVLFRGLLQPKPDGSIKAL